MMIIDTPRMTSVDVLIITALPMELDATRASLLAAGASMTPCDEETSRPYLFGILSAKARQLRVALARPTRMGATATAPIAGALSERLSPQCLAMSGVCAGNPADVSLGDVVVAECAYAYDEGKLTTGGFEPDHRQIPLGDRWLRAAQEMVVDGLPTYGAPSAEDSQLWLLSQLDAGADPRKHPARDRYLGDGKWTAIVSELQGKCLIRLEGRSFSITDAGRKAFNEAYAYTIESPTKLPFAVRAGPIASGNVVVKDGLTWDRLKAWGVRTAMGLEMEAATIAQTAQRLAIPHWLVAKGVMDYADPKKEDCIKPFAARASADVLVRLLQTVPFESAQPGGDGGANVIGNVTGSGHVITQIIGGGKS